MSFQEFAEQHGLIIGSLVHDRWTRVSTTDKPNKKNGSYIYDGNSGAVQNWAVHEKPVSFKGKHDPLHIIRKPKIVIDVSGNQTRATNKAAYILGSALKKPHPYLAKKGFPEEKGWVWNELLVIPMRIDGDLVGCQLIDPEGNKKFLSGQKTKKASAIFDNKGPVILCEGYATALSIRRALKAIRTRYKIVVCFSAGNLSEIANTYPDSVLVADHDPIGIRVSKQISRPYWISPNQGEDFNDYELRVGSEIAGKALSNLIKNIRKQPKAQTEPNKLDHLGS
jgi:putative DNA primase/helicase